MPAEFRQEFYLWGTQIEVFHVITIWFNHNKYKVKKVNEYFYIKANKGTIFTKSSNDVKRWLEVKVSKLPDGIFVTILGKNRGLSKIILEEGKELVAFLMSMFEKTRLSNRNMKYCIFCGEGIRIDAVFCDKCGKKQE